MGQYMQSNEPVNGLQSNEAILMQSVGVGLLSSAAMEGGLQLAMRKEYGSKENAKQAYETEMEASNARIRAMANDFKSKEYDPKISADIDKAFGHYSESLKNGGKKGLLKQLYQDNKADILYGGLYEDHAGINKRMQDTVFDGKTAGTYYKEMANNFTNNYLGSELITDAHAKDFDKLNDSKGARLLMNGISTKYGRINSYGITGVMGLASAAMTIGRKGEEDSALNGLVIGAGTGAIGTELSSLYLRQKGIKKSLKDMKENKINISDEQGSQIIKTIDRHKESLKNSSLLGATGKINQAVHDISSGIDKEGYGNSAISKATATRGRRWGLRGAGAIAGGAIGYGVDAMSKNIVGEK